MENKEHKDRFRMYGLVPYNISPIQQGIQFGHALQEFNNMLGETYGGRPSPSYDAIGDDFNTWRLEDKTFIILNGGTSITMEQHILTLLANGFYIGVFREPNLNNMVSGIVFLVPEQVYKEKEYPDFKTWMIKRNPVTVLLKKQTAESLKDTFPDSYTEWLTLIGGNKNEFLKEFTSQFELA